MTLHAEGDAITRDEAMGRLAERGLTASSQRVALLSLLLNVREGHISADEIFQRLRAQFPTLSRATVYNNLALLADVGLIEKLNTFEGARFGPEARPHINLVCEQCGAITDVLAGDPEIEGLVRRAAQSAGFQVDAVSMSVAGRCSACRTAPTRR